MNQSSLFSKFGNQLPSLGGGFANMIGQFQQFRQTFTGDAEQQVKQMLNNGQMSQQQFNQLSQMATQFQNMMRGRF